MNLNPIQQMALKIAKSNPNIVNDPQAMGYIQALESGDEKKCEEIANNLCETFKANQNEAVNYAKNVFGNMFGRPN